MKPRKVFPARRDLLLSLLAAAIPASLCAQAPARKRRLGILSRGHGPEHVLGGGLKDLLGALAKAGFAQGSNLEIESRYAGERDEALQALATELVVARVDAILTEGTIATHAAQRATRTIPIVTTVADPVAAGFAREIRRPGGNVTGLSQGLDLLARKNIELLREMVPGLSAIGIIVAGRTELHELMRAHWVAAARELGIEPRAVVGDRSQVVRNLEALAKAGIRAAVVHPGDAEGAKAAVRYRIATIGLLDDNVAQGMLAAITPDGRSDSDRIAAIVAKVLRGVPPSEIPFEQPTRFHTEINAKTAAALGLTLGPAVRLRADRIIE